MRRARVPLAPGRGAGACKGVIATSLAAILVLQTALTASASTVPKNSSQQQTEQVAALKKKVLKVQPQSMVVVKLKSGGQLRGRLTQVTDENFTVKVLKGENFADRQFDYNEVASVKPEKSGGSQVKKWLLIGVVTGAVLAVVGIVMLATSDT